MPDSTGKITNTDALDSAHPPRFLVMQKWGITRVDWRKWQESLNALAVDLWAGGAPGEGFGCRGQAQPVRLPWELPPLLSPSPAPQPLAVQREADLVWFCPVCVTHLCVPKVWPAEGLDTYTERARE